MSTKNKSKSWYRQKPSSNVPKHNCLPFSAEEANGTGPVSGGRHRQSSNGSAPSPRSRRSSQTEQFNVPPSPSYLRDGRPQTTPSRVPVYTANGSPHGYNYPYDPHSLRLYSSRTFFNQMPSPGSHHSQLSRPYGYFNSPSYPSTPCSSIVPYDVRLQHAVHQCHWTDFNRRSAPSSSRTTPRSSEPGTPVDSSRKKKCNGVKSSISTPSKALSRQSSVQGSARSAPSSTAKSARAKQFEKYMPLCEVQKALKKGEVIEGVLRINPRNYEDAYISAPDAEMDIYICGINDRNRALNGDRVAVRVNTRGEWKILYENIRNRWNEWSDEILMCAKSKQISDGRSKDVSLRANKTDLEPISEHTVSSFAPATSCTVSEPSTSQTACTVVDKSEASAPLLQSLDEFVALDIKQDISLGQTLQPRSDFDLKCSNEDANPDEIAQKAVESDAEASKAGTGNEPSKITVVHQSGCMEPPICVEAPLCFEPQGWGLEKLPVDMVKLLNFSGFVEQCESASDFSLSAVTEASLPGVVSDGSLTVHADEIIAKDHIVAQLTSCTKSEEQKPMEATDSKFVPLEDLSEADSVDHEDGLSDLEHHVEQAMEDLQLVQNSENILNNNNNDTEVNHVVNNGSNVQAEGNQPHALESQSEPPIEKSLKDLIEKLNGMQVIARCKVTGSNSAENEVKKANSKAAKKSRKKKEKKANGGEDGVKLPQISKNQGPRKSRSDVVRDLGLPDELALLSPEDLLTLKFGPSCVQRTGVVIAILERNHPRAAGGKLKLTADKSPNWAFFSPLDSKIPRMLIPMKQCPKNFFHHPDHFANSLFAAQIEDWPENSNLPIGRLVKILGKAGDIEAETEMILIENGIDASEFDDSVYEGLPLIDQKSDFVIPEEEWTYRRLFTNECVFTIDPPTARDLDDALSIKSLKEKGPNGEELFEVGVHIADVSYFVADQSNCDRIASSRATSVYLVQRVIPMLPRLLCEKLCSLNPGESKLTFSAVFKMDTEGRVYEEWFGRTIISSCIKLSYPLAQDMIDRPHEQWDKDKFPQIHDRWNLSDISSRVNQLMTIARSLRKKRHEGGALHFSRLKLWFDLDDETGLPLSCAPEARRESNYLVEEFMLLANMAVARKIYLHFPELAFLRRHPPPSAKLFKEFEEFCASVGLKLDTSSFDASKSSIVQLMKDSNVAEVVSQYFLKTMTMARYFCPGSDTDYADFIHFALNVPLYTHFTSPIRRYADVIVHRQLASALDCNNQKFNLDVDDLRKQAKRCNDRKYYSAMASEASVKFFMNLYIKQVGPLVVQGVVSQVLDHAFDVIISNFGQISRIYAENLDVAGFHYKGRSASSELILTWKNKREKNGNKVQVITPFAVVTLRIMVGEPDLNKLNVTLLFGEEIQSA